MDAGLTSSIMALSSQRQFSHLSHLFSESNFLLLSLQGTLFNEIKDEENPLFYGFYSIPFIPESRKMNLKILIIIFRENKPEPRRTTDLSSRLFLVIQLYSIFIVTGHFGFYHTIMLEYLSEKYHIFHVT